MGIRPEFDVEPSLVLNLTSSIQQYRSLHMTSSRTAFVTCLYRALAFVDRDPCTVDCTMRPWFKLPFEHKRNCYFYSGSGAIPCLYRVIKAVATFWRSA